MKAKFVASVVASLGLVASQPAMAADHFLNAGATQRQSAGFAGLNLRFNVRNGALVPTARLALSMTQQAYDSRGPVAEASRTTALELGLSNLGRPDFYLAGQRLNGIDKRLGVAPAAAVLLVAGAVAVGTVATGSLHNGKPRDPKTGCPVGVEVCTQ